MHQKSEFVMFYYYCTADRSLIIPCGLEYNMCNLYIVYYTLLGMYISDLNIQYSDLVYIQTCTYFIYIYIFLCNDDASDC